MLTNPPRGPGKSRFSRYCPGSIGPIQSPPGGRTSTANRSWGLYQISSSFSDRSGDAVADDDPVDDRCRALARQPGPRMDAPHDVAKVVRAIAASCPALPAATETDRPGSASGVDPARDSLLESWAWPFVPRLILMEIGRSSALPDRVR